MFQSGTKQQNKVIAALRLYGKFLGMGMAPAKALKAMRLATRHLTLDPKEPNLTRIWAELDSRLKAGQSLKESCEVILFKFLNVDLKGQIARAEKDGTLVETLSQLPVDWDKASLETEPDTSTQKAAVVQLLDKILRDAMDKNAVEITINGLPEAEQANTAEPVQPAESDIGDILQGLQPSTPTPKNADVFTKTMDGNWEMLCSTSAMYLPALINRICFLADIPYWVQVKTTGILTFRGEQEKRQHHVTYSPQDQSIQMKLVSE